MMTTPGGATPSGGALGVDVMRVSTMMYICGECHVEQEIKPKVNFETPFYEIARISWLFLKISF